MLSIKEVEKITGISKQNIRYYERQGLINPRRNEENDYREYSQADVRILKIIKLFRKLDMPIEEIRKLLEDEVQLQEAVKVQKERLEKEKQRLTDAIDFCKKISERELGSLDVDCYLNQIEQEEGRGAVFADLVNDFKKVAKAEHIREFRFMPDNMCKTPREFTDSLLQYARENNLNLVVTKECMYPEFTLDGIEYVADRFFTRYGAVIRCQMKHPEKIVPKEIPASKYKIIKNILKLFIPVTVVLVIVVPHIQRKEELIWYILILLGVLAAYMAVYGHFHNMKN